MSKHSLVGWLFIIPLCEMCFTQVADARAQVLHGYALNVWTGGNSGYGLWGESGTFTSSMCPTSGTLSNLYVESSAAPGAGKSWVLTVRQNGSNTTLTCTISGSSATTCSDTVNTVTVSAADTFDLLTAPSGTPSGVNLKWAVQFDDGTANQSIFGGGSNGSITTGAVVYLPLTGSQEFGASTESQVQLVLPTGGTLKTFTAKTNAAPGAGKSWTFTIRQNEANTTLTCQVSGASATSCTDSTNTVTVSAGDRIDYTAQGSGGPSGNSPWGGVVLSATTDGDFVTASVSNTALSASATNYQAIQQASIAPNATETNRQIGAQATTVKAIYVNLDTAPGAGTSYAITFRNNAAATAATCTVSGTGTTCNLTGQSVSLANFDNPAFESVPSTTPAASKMKASILEFITPPTTRRVMMVQ